MRRGLRGNLLNDGQRTFMYDTANRLKQVVSGTLTTQYAYASASLSTSLGVGSVRQMTNILGVVQQSVDYDPFGNVLHMV